MFNQTKDQLTEASSSIKHLTESEIQDVLESARKISARDHALLLVGYIYGCRNQEIAQLRLTDINWSTMMITIRRLKGSRIEPQPLVRHKGRPALDVVGALQLWLAERKDDPSGLVFPSKKCATSVDDEGKSRGKALSQRSVSTTVS